MKRKRTKDNERKIIKVIADASSVVGERDESIDLNPDDDWMTVPIEGLTKPSSPARTHLCVGVGT